MDQEKLEKNLQIIRKNNLTVLETFWNKKFLWFRWLTPFAVLLIVVNIGILIAYNSNLIFEILLFLTTPIILLASIMYIYINFRLISHNRKKDDQNKIITKEDAEYYFELPSKHLFYTSSFGMFFSLIITFIVFLMFYNNTDNISIKFIAALGTLNCLLIIGFGYTSISFVRTYRNKDANSIRVRSSLAMAKRSEKQLVRKIKRKKAKNYE